MSASRADLRNWFRRSSARRPIGHGARVGEKEPVNGWIALILYLLLAPAFWAYLQVSLNDLWRSEAEPLPGQLAPPVPEKMPPRQPVDPQRSESSEGEPRPPEPPPPGSAS
jgi:hypothetical protein